MKLYRIELKDGHVFHEYFWSMSDAVLAYNDVTTKIFQEGIC